MTAGLLAVAAVATLISVVRGLRVEDPFLDPRLFRSVPFSAAALVSLLTGYAFATAIIGGAVFVDRVLYGGPDQQRLALGALAGATAVGALLSGLIVRVVPLRVVALVGLVLSIGALLAMSRWTSTVSLDTVAISLGAFGLGFGLTVTPRSTAAVEAAGRRAFGTASAVVTVARMIGMAVGLAILTAYGSTTIDRLYVEVYASPDAYQQFIPEALRDRPLRDPLVVGALEDWASREAAAIMVGLFIVAAGVSAVAIPPSLTLGGSRGRTRMLDDAPAAKDATEAAAAGGSDADGLDRARTRPRPLTTRRRSRSASESSESMRSARPVSRARSGSWPCGATASSSSRARPRWPAWPSSWASPRPGSGSISSPRRKPRR